MLGILFLGGMFSSMILGYLFVKSFNFKPTKKPNWHIKPKTGKIGDI